MLAFAIFLELAGGLLLIFNSTLGAFLLVNFQLCFGSQRDSRADKALTDLVLNVQSCFMVAVTPVMHNFWDEKENSQGRLNETINFFKVCPDFTGFMLYCVQTLQLASNNAGRRFHTMLG